jgi:colanic acid/amylovoran biosynthesis glycosyltransferase
MEGLNFECNIIGEGPLFEELETLIREYNLEKCVHLLGGQPQVEVIKQLNEADVFVLAAVISRDGKRDGMPVALAEAMSMEIPVISTDIVGFSEMVKPSAGFLVPPNDTEALAAAIKQLWEESPRTRTEMGETGRKIISEEFELYKGTAQLAELLSKSPSGFDKHATI